MRLTLALALAMALLVAGCVGADGATSPSPADAGPDDDSLAMPPGSPEPANAGAIAEPFALDGRTPARLCAPTPPAGCSGFTLPFGPAGNHILLVPANGSIQSVSAQVTWSAATPATAELEAFVGAGRDCGETCFEVRELSPRVAGASPLALQALETVLAEDEKVFILVYEPCLRQDPILACVGAGQAFHVEGTALTI